MHDLPVLIVDDEPAVRMVIARQLTLAGIKAESVGCADDAEDRVRQGGIAVCILDVQMPGRSGIELMSCIRGFDPSMPIIFLTGFSDQTRDYPNIPLVTKPPEMRDLVGKVQHELRSRCRDEKIGSTLTLAQDMHKMLTKHLLDYAGDRVRIEALEARPASLGEMITQEAKNPVVWGMVLLLLGLTGIAYRLFATGGKLS